MHTPLTSKVSEFDEWSALTTVNSFDAGPTQPMDEAEGGGLLLQDVNRFSSLSLLVESLIDQLCKLMETDVARQKSLYLAICNKLFKMKLIDQTYGIEEFQFVRSHYQKALFQLLSVAKTSNLGNDTASSLLPVSSSTTLNSSIFLKHQLLDISRYHTEYEELEYIAKGGFGRVHRARNKLDGGEYAIKKICLRYRNVRGFLRSLQEVKMLAQLNHPNIVAYKAAWLEKYSPPNAPVIGANVNPEELASFLAAQSRKSRPKVVIGSYSEEDSIVFKNSHSDERFAMSSIRETYDESSVINLEGIFEETSRVGVSMQYESYRSEVHKIVSHSDRNGESRWSEDGDSSSSSVEDRAMCEYRGFPIPNSSMQDVWKFDFEPREWATLFVQMQLCESTLRQWLDKRNSASKEVDVKLNLRTFAQIVRGIEYIHSRGIVHHDIKPSNIFVDKAMRLAQVGDFGLACCLQHSATGLETFVPDAQGMQHRGEIGTKLYAAPEQLNGKCDPKSDIYSLGIVLFELMQPFSTEMERSKVIGLLKSGCIPPQLAALSPKLVQVIKLLISRSPKNRPTASDLLVQIEGLLQEISGPSSPEASKDETIVKLQNIIAAKDKEIEELKKQLRMLQPRDV